MQIFLTVLLKYAINILMKTSYITITTRALKVTRGAVHKWAALEKRPTVEHALQLEDLYGFPMSCFLTSERSQTWLKVKALSKECLNKKLASFFDKQNINTNKQDHNGNQL